MTERRFTDREVARIFERATAMDETAGGGTEGRGLSLVQLQDIGREVGISPERIRRAVDELHRPSAFRLGNILGANRHHREIGSVPRRLSSEEIARLVQVMDERVPAQGTVTEALGSVRWSAEEWGLSRQLSVEPGDAETLIRVEERYSPRTSRLVHLLPTGYGAMFGLMLADWLGGGLPALFGMVILGLAGWALGRGIWSVMSGRSAARTHALAEELAEVAGGLSAPSRSAGPTPGSRPSSSP